MKYIYSIVGIILLMTCVIWFVGTKDSTVRPGKNALVINDRLIPFADLLNLWKQKPYHYGDEKEFIDDLVLREVLIQEAIASGIADEDQFKRHIQDFFEQSLLKTLLDRKQQGLTVEVSSRDFLLFQTARQSRYQLTLLRYQSNLQATEDEGGQPETRVDAYVLLPESLQTRLLGLEVGELSVPFADGTDFVRLRVDAVEVLPVLPKTLLSDVELTQQLHDMLQQRDLDEWIQQVRQRAVVQYPQQRLGKEGD